MQIPVYNQINRNLWDNHFSWRSCPTFETIFFHRKDELSLWEKYEWITDIVKPGIETQLDLTKEQAEHEKPSKWRGLAKVVSC